MFATWMDYVMLLMEGSSVVITASLVLFGIPILRQQLLSQESPHPKQLYIILLFSILAIYGTHAGKVVSSNGGLESVTWSQHLEQNEAVVNFRDMVVVTAGLAAGPWVGLSVGGIAGFERFSLGGFTALPCAIASILSGLFAGLYRRRKNTMVKPNKAAIIAAITVLLQMLLILFLAKPFFEAQQLVQQIGIPMLVTAAVGSYAFQQALRGLEKIRLQLEAKRTEIRAQRAEIRALHAQIEPHFLMNILNAIKTLIRIDRHKARHYITMLGEFLDETRTYATHDTIAIKDELLHVKKYLDFQELRFSANINYEVNIEKPQYLDYKIPPRSLLTLIENALVHGFSPQSKLKSIKVNVFKDNNNLHISVEDNGTGIKQQNTRALCNKPVISQHKQGGLGLYNLKNTLVDLYGEASNLEIDSRPNQEGTIVQLTLPMKSASGVTR